MPLFIPATTQEEADEIERQVHAASDRVIATDSYNCVVDIMCDPGEEEEVMQQLTRAGILNILSM